MLLPKSYIKVPSAVILVSRNSLYDPQKLRQIAFCAFARVVNQFFDDNLKSIHFRAYVASQVIYKCDPCGYFCVFKKSLRPSEAEIAFCAFALVLNQFFDDNLKSIHFRGYVASQVIYKCDLCGYFAVFKKSLRPSQAEIVFLAKGAKGRGHIGTFPTPGRLSPGRYRFYTP